MTPAQLRCLQHVRDHGRGGGVQLAVFLRCVRNGWIIPKDKGLVGPMAAAELTLTGWSILSLSSDAGEST